MLPPLVEYSNRRSSPLSVSSPPFESVPRITENVISSRLLVSNAKLNALVPAPVNLICLATLNPPNSPTPLPVLAIVTVLRLPLYVETISSGAIVV